MPWKNGQANREALIFPWRSALPRHNSEGADSFHPQDKPYFTMWKLRAERFRACRVRCPSPLQSAPGAKPADPGEGPRPRRSPRGPQGALQACQLPHRISAAPEPPSGGRAQLPPPPETAPRRRSPARSPAAADNLPDPPVLRRRGPAPAARPRMRLIQTRRRRGPAGGLLPLPEARRWVLKPTPFS